jgi:hypothetical protein
VQWEVAFEPNVKVRARVLLRFVEIAAACSRLKAFSVAFAIRAALDAPPIYRLDRTRAEMRREGRRETIAALEALKRDCSHELNYRAPLALLANCEPPCVPYLGIFLKQLTGVEEGTPDFLPPAVAGGPRLINFAKRRKVAEILQRVQTFQAARYAFDTPAGDEVDEHLRRTVGRWTDELHAASLASDRAYQKALEGAFDRASRRAEPRRAGNSPGGRRASLDSALVGGGTSGTPPKHPPGHRRAGGGGGGGGASSGGLLSRLARRGSLP